MRVRRARGAWRCRGAFVAALVAIGALAGCGGGDQPSDEPSRSVSAGPLPDGVLSVGVQDDQLPVADPTTLELRMDTLESTGAKVSRIDVVWNAVAPTKPANGSDPNDPAYDWSRYDTILDGLAKRGITVIVDVYRTPSWANGGKGVEWAPTDVDAYAAFIRALATRYDGATKDRDGATHARVQMFEPWNEPNIPLFLMPQWENGQPASPRIYAEMIKRAYTEIHAAQPDAIVVGPCGGPTGKDKPPDGSVGILTFIDTLDELDPTFDALSQHIYPAPAPTAETTAVPAYATLPRLVEELDRLAPGAPILITEMGYTTAKTRYRATAVTEEEQAEYLPQALELLAAEPRIRLAMWFNLQDNPDWPGGLMRLDDGRTKKPSWQVFVDADKAIPSGTDATP